MSSYFFESFNIPTFVFLYTRVGREVLDSALNKYLASLNNSDSDKVSSDSY